MTTDELITALANRAATEVAEVAAMQSLASINERDHLQPASTRSARAIVDAAGDLVVSTSLRFLSPLWPRLGSLDLAFSSGSGQPVVVELKAGAGHNALLACAWDAVKLAFLLRLREVEAGYVVAASPASGWAAAHRGTEFFTTRRFQTAALREPYLDGWKLWERDGYPAGKSLPATFATRYVSSAPFLVSATEWHLRAAAVEAVGEEWVEWKPLLDGDVRG